MLRLRCVCDMYATFCDTFFMSSHALAPSPSSYPTPMCQGCARRDCSVRRFIQEHFPLRHILLMEFFIIALSNGTSCVCERVYIYISIYICNTHTQHTHTHTHTAFGRGGGRSSGNQKREPTQNHSFTPRSMKEALGILADFIKFAFMIIFTGSWSTH